MSKWHLGKIVLQVYCYLVFRLDVCRSYVIKFIIINSKRGLDHGDCTVLGGELIFLSLLCSSQISFSSLYIFVISINKKLSPTRKDFWITLYIFIIHLFSLGRTRQFTSREKRNSEDHSNKTLQQHIFPQVQGPANKEHTYQSMYLSLLWWICKHLEGSWGLPKVWMLVHDLKLNPMITSQEQ